MTEAWFPPGAVLEPHTHDRMIFAVMLEGSFHTLIAHRRLECIANTVWTEPLAERHANRVGSAGARVLVVQPQPDRGELFGAFQRLLEEVHCVTDPQIALDGRRVLTEMDLRDSVSPAAIEALALGMMVVAERRSRSEPRGAGPPPWLCRARDLLHEQFRTRLDLSEIARVADVTPSHLCQAFRRYFGTTLGEYVRRLRVVWAAERLIAGAEPVAAIAAAAGYADQSHLTREFKRAFGLGPAEYRRKGRARSLR
ncbi:MAG: helix-turn-helix domain-containing protein [Gemmatimonadales bacterium]